MPDPYALAERVRELALSLPETYEDEPWGHPVFKVADNRMFNFGVDRGGLAYLEPAFLHEFAERVGQGWTGKHDKT